MRLRALKLRDFRCYRGEIEIPFDEDLTAFIGRNDAGKSSVLDALGIFFDSPTVKFESEDRCVHAQSTEVRIGCVFTDLPRQLTIDVTSETALEDEYLLNENGDLEVHKIYECSSKNPKPRVVAIATHPTADGVNDLLFKKNAELKRLLKDLAPGSEGVDQRSNPALRRAIWKSRADLQIQRSEIDLNKEDAKKIWDQLQAYMPVFALFRADRPSTDEDSEVQDPMKIAVQQAMAELAQELRAIEEKVRDATLKVASRTLEKLNELDPSLAKDLSPVFRTDPKWDSIFKLALTTEDQIPVNKRGSGVRRLILLGFFRAEAERRRAEEGRQNIIYAIKEPEASQHPANQRIVIEALKDLSETEGCQVILTTHVPGLAELVSIDGLRYVRAADGGTRCVERGSEDVLRRVADDLGVLPDNRVRVIVCLEGPNDVAFVRNMARLLREAGRPAIDLERAPEVVVMPLGGSTLRDWVNNHYLRRLGKPEIHIYDRGTDDPPKYQSEVQKVNARGDQSRGFLTSKAEAENYLHPSAIEATMGVSVKVDDTNDVPMLVARALHERDPNAKSWDELDDDKKRKKCGQAKRRLNEEVAAAMTLDLLRERGGVDEMRGWFKAIDEQLR